LADVNLSNVQGNVLKAFGKPNVRVVFFNFTDNEKAKQWLRNLANDLPSSIDIKNAKEKNQDVKEPWTHVSLTASGIKKIGKKIPPSQDNPDPNKDAFKDGMKSRKGILGDEVINGSQNWVEPFKSNSDKIDGLLILAANEKPPLLDESVSKLRREANDIGVDILRVEIGKVIKNKHDKDIEHFGFRDGVSQPIVKGMHDEKKGHKTFLPEDFVLSSADPWINDGSFLVFRRLKQDVFEFKKDLKEMGAELGMTEDELGAKFVGRWKSGAPLAKEPKSDPDSKDGADDNDFKYMDDDADGKKTPRFSHIRKAYPRGDGFFDIKKNQRDNDTHRMLRRGAPYGKPFDPKDAKSKKIDRGLLFMCYVKDIPRQFEFVQQMWANNPGFPKPDKEEGKEIEHGHDPIIGQHGGAGVVQLKREKFIRIPKSGGFDQWVKMTGGEYFFSPSISSLKEL